VPKKGCLVVSVALLVRLEAKLGKEDAVRKLLESGLSLAQAEPGTSAWFALQLGPGSFGIFDAFPDEDGRSAHLAGRFAAELMANAPDLLADPPNIEQVKVLAAKLPG
jgi:quinol monooxygenase YgiN